jgi:hypothetical protein
MSHTEEPMQRVGRSGLDRSLTVVSPHTEDHPYRDSHKDQGKQLGEIL